MKVLETNANYKNKPAHWRSFPRISRIDAKRCRVSRESIIDSTGLVYVPCRTGGYNSTEIKLR